MNIVPGSLSAHKAVSITCREALHCESCGVELDVFGQHARKYHKWDCPHGGGWQKGYSILDRLEIDVRKIRG